MKVMENDANYGVCWYDIDVGGRRNPATDEIGTHMQRTNPDLFTVDPAKTRTLRAEADSIDWLNLDRVLPHHRVYLARRGVSAFVAKGRGYESAGNGTMRPERLPDTATGWTEEQRADFLGIAPVVPEPAAP